MEGYFLFSWRVWRCVRPLGKSPQTFHKLRIKVLFSKMKLLVSRIKLLFLKPKLLFIESERAADFICAVF